MMHCLETTEQDNEAQRIVDRTSPVLVIAALQKTRYMCYLSIISADKAIPVYKESNCHWDTVAPSLKKCPPSDFANLSVYCRPLITRVIDFLRRCNLAGKFLIYSSWRIKFGC